MFRGQLQLAHFIIMIDEERHALNFEGDYNEFHVALILSRNRVVHSSGGKLPHACEISTRYRSCLSLRENFGCPADPITLFEYLTSHFADAVVEDVQVYMGTIAKREKLIVIDLVQEKMSGLQLARLEIDRLSKLLLQRDADIKINEEKGINAQKEIRIKEDIIGLQQELRQAEQRQQRLQKSEKSKDATIGQMELRLEQTERLLKQSSSEVELLKSQLQQYEEVVKNLPFNENQTKKLSVANIIARRSWNEHQKYYALTTTGTATVKIVRQLCQGESHHYKNFVSNEEILPGMKAKYRIKIIKCKNNIIFVGFCTRGGGNNMNNFESPWSVYFQCIGSGYFWQEGVPHAQGHGGNVDGDVLQIEAYLTAGVMRWWRNGKKVRDYFLSERMKGNTFFLSVIIKQAGGEVELSRFT